MKATETLLCDFIGYEISGDVRIKDWTDSIGLIRMKPVMIKAEELGKTFELTDDVIKENLNDAGFGCKEILNGIVVVLAVYTHGAKSFIEERNISAAEPITEEAIREIQNFENLE